MKRILIILLVIIFSQSCKDDITKQDGHSKGYGIVTDRDTGEPLSGIKLEIKIYNYGGAHSFYEDTEYSTTTNEKGYYEIEFPKTEYMSVIVPNSDEYAYTESSYPHIPTNGLREINIKLVKRGNVRIEGDVMHRTFEQNFLLENVKISVLKRKIGNSDYPMPTGIETYTDSEGKYYIEYEGNKDYEFFLKPEKEGYYYTYLQYKYKEFPNLDPGYVKSGDFSMDKEN